MAHGLLGAALLLCFLGLAWAGWREYQKVASYQVWANQFESAKYDIYAVLGQKGSDLTWGRPTPNGPTDLVTFSLTQVKRIGLSVDQQEVDFKAPPSRGQKVLLEFWMSDRDLPWQVPFTEIPLAARWTSHLQKDLETLTQKQLD